MQANATTTTRQVEPSKPLFEARTTDAVDLKRIVRTLAATATEAPVRFDRDGVHVLTADAAMVAMIDLDLTPELFDRFNPPADGVTVNVNLDELKDAVCEARKGDRVTITVENARVEREMQTVVSVRIWSDGITTEYQLTSVDAELETPETDDLEFSAEATVSVEKFADAVKRMDKDSGVEVRLSEEELELSGGSGVSVEFPANSDYLHGPCVDDGTGSVASLYSVEYLENLRKLKNTATWFKVRFATDFPLKVSATDDRFKLSYILAPRIEEE